ncbi:MAG: type II secretion system protein [bacterium]
MRRCQGFTLIELLIVVAIIGILAAIAVPNFLNAQTRARVSRTAGDLRAIGLAIQSYLVDENSLPPNNSHLTVDLKSLTTPISYISSVGFKDIFKAKQGATGNDQESYLYFSYQLDPNNVGMSWIGQIPAQFHDLSTKGFCLSSWGPDRWQDAIEWVYVERRTGSPEGGNFRIYHATNGLTSAGDIGRWGGDVPGVSVTEGS